jgi:pimeloyl-ACP methyl ester carboxylesterase
VDPRPSITSADAREVTVANGDVTLAGTIWLPSGRDPTAAVYMHPGSGPSDRDNDVYFPPIRDHLLASGFAVCSFDKRGVGESTGRWQDAGILEQADDTRACVSALVAEDLVPIGLFGHSQGGWVVVEAAGRGAPVAFVVANSGPGVTPARQERYATRTYLVREGATPAQVEAGLERFDEMLELIRSGTALADVDGWTEGHGIPAAVEGLELAIFPDEPELWEFMASIADYDPRPALERIRVPVLALFGADDRIVPVEESVALYREAVAPELLTAAVLPGASHRLQTGDPPRLVDDYLETLSGFVTAAVA